MTIQMHFFFRPKYSVRIATLALLFGVTLPVTSRANLEALLRLPSVRVTLLETSQGRALIRSVLGESAEGISSLRGTEYLRDRHIQEFLSAIASPVYCQSADRIAQRLTRIERRAQQLPNAHLNEIPYRRLLAAEELEFTWRRSIHAFGYRHTVDHLEISFAATFEETVDTLLSSGASPGATLRSYFLQLGRSVPTELRLRNTLINFHDLLPAYRVALDGQFAPTPPDLYIDLLGQTLTRSAAIIAEAERLVGALPTQVGQSPGILPGLNLLDQRVAEVILLLTSHEDRLVMLRRNLNEEHNSILRYRPPRTPHTRILAQFNRRSEMISELLQAILEQRHRLTLLLNP